MAATRMSLCRRAPSGGAAPSPLAEAEDSIRPG
jgi:hypothetical protein